MNSEVLSVSVMGKKFLFNRFEVAVGDCVYDPTNPRYRKPDGTAYTESELISKLHAEAATNDLAKSIITNGLVSPLVVKKEGNKYTVKEGNRRLCAIKKAKEKLTKEKKCTEAAIFDNVEVFIIPSDMDDKHLAALIDIKHVQGKLPWDKYGRACYLRDLVEKFKWTEEEVVDMLGIKKTEIRRHIKACNSIESAISILTTTKEESLVEEPTKEESLVEEPTKEESTKEESLVEEPTKEESLVEEPTKEESTKEESLVEEPTKEESLVEDLGSIGSKRYYHFWEFEGTRLKNDKEAKEAFVKEGILKGKIADSVNVRRFPEIWENEKARKTFLEGDGKQAFDDALRVLRKEEPENVKGGIFKEMEKLRHLIDKQYKDVAFQLKTSKSKGSTIYWKLFDTLVEAAKENGQKEEVKRRLEKI